MKLDKLLSTRTTVEHHQHCQTQAALFGISLSEWILRACGGVPQPKKSTKDKVQLQIKLPADLHKIWKIDGVPLGQWLVENLPDGRPDIHTYWHGEKVDPNDPIIFRGEIGKAVYFPNEKWGRRWMVTIGKRTEYMHPSISSDEITTTIYIPATTRNEWKARARVEKISISKWLIAMIGENQ